MKKKKSVNQCLSVEELKWSENFLYQTAQLQDYKKEMTALSRDANITLSKISPLRKLSPFTDAQNVLRLKGRLDKAVCIDDSTKFPIILSRKNYITKLIVDWYHRKWKHLNHETVVNEIFQKYHIPGLRRLLKQVRNNCQHCKVRDASPKPPEMSVLPEARLSAYSRPFSHVGIDYFGPYTVTVGRRSEKRYGVVFTCLTYRAVHLEIAYSLSASSCCIVIRNFIARRGVPNVIYSDNGTNLTAAEKELREAIKNVNFNELQSEFTSPETQWVFLPPAAPHMGGAWERMVRSIKTVLGAIISPQAKINDEKMHNLFCEVESIINSRPLTYLSIETASEEALTPNHFLLGSSSGNKPPGKFDTNDEHVKSSWRHSQYLADRFWKKWIQEVLPTMTRRTKWFGKIKPLEAGDVVIIVDPNSPRYTWPKGIVISAIKARDGQTRSAIVQTTRGQYHRPAAKLAVLDVRGAAV
ncbi:uncharacterized protein LOC119662163 [Teleopsis dalmanni]|uniref:uncharacterized protein LOC119662163 n=1 Tax=Teleopsis dalmanni TaxID=139649 RepID=UPI0018CED480|nr:uncharacterized protein LOC119662163 [Teleopsis dalmanni]